MRALSSMSHAFVYRGHRVEVEAVPAGERWQWCYRVDDGPAVCGPPPGFLLERASLAEGSQVARSAIDRVP
jgi:hypothetical protein